MPTQTVPQQPATPAFLPLPLPAAPGSAAQDIVIELKRGATTATIHWPSISAAACATWLQEWKDVLERLPSWPYSRIDELLPHRWTPASRS